MRGCYAKLALKVNESKTAVASVWGRKFLGYCFWAYKGEAKRAVAKPAQDKLRERLRQLTSRTRGRSLEQIAADLRDYVPGWKSYFRLAQTPKTMRELDQWLRRRLRAVQLKQWRSGPTIFRELRRLGARSLRGRRSLSQKVAISGVADPSAISRKSSLRDSERSNFEGSFFKPSSAQPPSHGRRGQHR